MRSRCAALALLALWLAVILAPSRAQAEIQTVTLSDGARLVMQPDPHAPFVAITVCVRTGAATSPKEEAEAQMVARALLFGSSDRTASWTAYLVDSAGGALDTLVGRRCVFVTCVTTASELQNAASALGDALTNADFRPASLSKAMSLIQKERTQRTDFDRGAAVLSQAVVGQPAASEQLLRHVSQDAARSYFLSRYTPENTVIALAGGFDPSAARTDFDAYLFDYRRRPRLAAADPEAAPKPPQPIRLVSTGPAAIAMVGMPAPGVSDPDYPAFLVLQALLGVGHRSRLFRNIRDAHGLGYEIGATYAADLGGPLIAYVEWDPARLAKAGSPLTGEAALRLLRSQVDGLVSAPPSAEEMRRARSIAIGREALRHQRARDRCFLLAWFTAAGLGPDFDAQLAGRLASVTAADVLRLARKYTSPPQRVCLLVAP